MHWLVSKFLAEEYRKKLLTFYSSNNDFLAYALFTWVIDNLKFKYRRKITVTEQSGNNLIDYQVLIELNSSNFDFSHAKSDGSDIRFYDGNNFLPYWIEKWDSISQEAKIWVKVPYIPANESVSFHIYYGNPNIISASSVSSVFIREIDGCVASWHLDEGTGSIVYDASGNNNDGTIYGGATWVDGKFGKALSCDGSDDYVEVPDSDSLDITNAITMECWVKLNELASVKGPNHFIRKLPEVYSLRQEQTNDRVRFALTLNGTTVQFTSNTVLDIGKFYHVVATYDSELMKIYIDGTFDKDNSATGTIDVSTDPLRIGRGEPAGYLNGIIDEVRVYNRALTPEEISDLYANYGYTTPNYPNKVLVRKRVDPEPSINIGNEEIS